MTTLTIVETEEEAPATIAELAVLNFVGNTEIRSATDKEMAEVARKRADEIYRLTYLALGMLKHDKDEFVTIIRDSKDPTMWCDFLDSLSYGEESIRYSLNFVTAAHARLSIAMSVIAQEPDDDPDGGEDITQEAIVA
jgi:hypothetical protein